MKVLVTLNIPANGVEDMRKSGLEVRQWTHPVPMSPQELLDATEDCQALLCTGMDRIDRSFLQARKNLKVISQYGAGYDNIDDAAAAEFDIVVGNTPGAMNDATADIAFLLMLAVSRKLCYLHKSIIAGDWGSFQPQAHLGQKLQHKTLGIFGLGRIGAELARRCQQAYNMEIIYCNRSVNSIAERELNARKVGFDDLLSTSDVLSVHCALTRETRGIFNAEAFEKMRGSSIFINTARGPVHNEKHLIQALQSGEIWGAGLDVTDPEPMKPDNPLLAMENVAITPHVGSATLEARQEMSRLAAQNIIEFYQGKAVTNRVN